MALRTDSSGYNAVDPYESLQFKQPCWKRKTAWIMIAASVLAAVVIVFIIHFVTDESGSSSASRAGNQFFEQQFIRIPSNDSCSNNSARGSANDSS